MRKKRIIAMGVFDGMHRGHQFIFKKVIERAKKLHGTSVAYTFHPHPVRVLAPHACPPMINTVEQRIDLIKGFGMDQVIVEKFTKTFARQTPQQFIDTIVLKKLAPSEIFVGYNFTFGVKRSGTAEDLQKMCAAHDIKVHIVTPYHCEETLVSSTQVRQFVSHGDMRMAADILGHPYFIEGKVVKGRGIGGKILGIPTANLKPENDIFLPKGVYVTQTLIGKRTYSSITNVGHNPTFQKPGKPPFITIETHLFHFHQNLLGKKIRVLFLKKLRDERKFNSPEELIQQIHEDIKNAKKHS